MRRTITIAALLVAVLVTAGANATGAFALQPSPEPSPTTVTAPPPPTTTAAPEEPPPPADDIGHRPIGTSSIVLFPAFLPDPFRPDADFGLDTALELTGVEPPGGPARPLPLHPEPITGHAPLLLTTGPSLQDEFVPPAILGVLIAWATLTLFEFQRTRPRRAGTDEVPGAPAN